MSHYFSVHVECSDDVKEQLQAVLFEFDCFGTEEEVNGFTAYFSEDNYSQAKLAELFNSLQSNTEFSFAIEGFEDQNWNAKWESDYQPIFVDDFCAIYAPFHDKKGGYKHELTINPQMAFGTGHHETTQMMLNQLQQVSLDGKTVLDLGSGTGILAIIAQKEGAKHTTAVDIDENAYEIMQQNFILNGAGNVKSLLGTVEVVNDRFDLILANINRNVLLAESERICERLNSGGLLIISGFYKKDVELLNAQFEQVGLVQKRQIEKNSWCSLIFKK